MLLEGACGQLYDVLMQDLSMNRISVETEDVNPKPQFQ